MHMNSHSISINSNKFNAAQGNTHHNYHCRYKFTFGTRQWRETCTLYIFTRGQFWPSGIVVACVCVCVCVSVNHELVRAILHQPFKLGSPNLDQRCKIPWLRALLFCGAVDLDLQGQIELKSHNLPHFEHASLSAR